MPKKPIENLSLAKLTRRREALTVYVMASPAIPPIAVARVVEKMRYFLDRLKRRLFPHAINILEIATSYWASQCLFVVAELDLAGQLESGPKDVTQLATDLKLHEESLYRVLRLLAGYGLFTEISARRFAMTTMSRPLLSDAPDSIRGMCRLYGRPFHWRAWGDLLHSVRTGEAAVEHQEKMPFFEFLAKNTHENEIFNEAMTGWATQAAYAVAKAYNFGQFKTVIDIGGGHGSLLAAILETYASLTGVLFDQEHVVAEARTLLKARHVLERCRVEGGSFFNGIPVGADAYILKNIIHDWNDDKSVEILRKVRAAISAHGKLLVIESVIPEGNEIHIGKLVDIEMLVCTSGGRERTQTQFRLILEKAGFNLRQIYPTAALESIIEARPRATAEASRLVTR